MCLKEEPAFMWLRRQEKEWSVIFLAETVNNELVRPLKQNDIEFLKVKLQTWLKKTVAFKRKVIFTHDNASAYAPSTIVEYLGPLGF